MYKYGTMVKVKLRSIRRVACDGLLGAFGRVLAHASGPHVSATVGTKANGNRHVFSECTTSVYTKCQQIQLEPRSVVKPSPMRGGLAEIGNWLTLRAAVGDFMTVETQSDELELELNNPIWHRSQCCGVKWGARVLRVRSVSRGEVGATFAITKPAASREREKRSIHTHTETDTAGYRK